MNNNRHNQIIEIVKEKLSCSAHNLDHVFRVHKLCMLIAESEKEVDLEILIPAVYLHDIARVEESHNKSGNIDHAVLGAEQAREILLKLDYSEEQIDKIAHCIVAHRFRSGNQPKTLEAKILFDSDKLDAIGAIGIARTFMLSGQFGQSLDFDQDTDSQVKSNSVENGRIKDVSKHTVFMEYEIKLRKIPSKLYTNKAKEIGIERIAYMDDFFIKLKSEIRGQE